MRPPKASAVKLLKTREDLNDTEKIDLAEALSRWSRSQEHARRIVAALPEHPSALDVRRTAEHVPVSTASQRPRPGCPYCFGSGFCTTIERNGYSGVQPCSCALAQPLLARLGEY